MSSEVLKDTHEINSAEEQQNEQTPKEELYFQCSTCEFKEKYEYFGKEPHFVKKYNFKENVYVIEDPFQPPKHGEFIILGAHCIKCTKSVCRDSNCSFYFDTTYCISCAKLSKAGFPISVQEKLNKLVVNI